LTVLTPEIQVKLVVLCSRFAVGQRAIGNVGALTSKPLGCVPRLFVC
jgi:hypothetical protein